MATRKGILETQLSADTAEKVDGCNNRKYKK